MTILSATEVRLMAILLVEALLPVVVLPVLAMITITAMTIQVGIIPIQAGTIPTRTRLFQGVLAQLPPRPQVLPMTIIGLLPSIHL
jgi:hypothetical protein